MINCLKSVKNDIYDLKLTCKHIANVANIMC